MKILKIIIILGLVSGVLYLGLKYYHPSSAAPVKSEAKKEIGELKTLHEELAVFEQKIRDLQAEGQPYADEEMAAEELKIKIQSLKTAIAGLAPAERPDRPPEGVRTAQDTLFGDKYQRVFIAVVGGLILLVIILVLINRLKGKPDRQKEKQPGSAPQNRPPRQPQPSPLPQKSVQAPSPARPEAPMVTDLKETLERFKAARIPQMKKGETGEMNLEGLKKEPVPAAPSAQETGPANPTGTVEKVFELSMRGLSVEEISGKLRIDQDQVRLILRFKQ